MATKTTSPSLDEIRKTAEGLLASGGTAAVLEYLLAALASLRDQNRNLEMLVAKLQREGFGRKSERIDPGQMTLLFEALAKQTAAQGDEGVAGMVPDAAAVSAADAALTAEIEGARKDEQAPRKKRKKKRDRVKLRNAETIRHEVKVPEAERCCERCGKPKRSLGEEVTRVVEFVPARFVEHLHVREKLACSSCKDEVTTAPGPARILPRSEAGPGLLAHLVVNKYADHCPLHRLHRIYGRAGVDLPVSTMADWIGGVAIRLKPIVERLAARVPTAHVVGTDATGLMVLDPDAAKNIVRGTVWCVVIDGQDVVFHYTPQGDGQSGPWKFLAGRKGYVQADGANVFDRLYNGEAASAIEVGCWCHARRKLEAIVENDCRAAYPLHLIGRLFRIEELANLRRLEPEQRRQLRLERSAPTLETLDAWVQAATKSEPPSSPLAKAAAYLKNQWQPLNRFLEDGRLRLDNMLVEQQIRDVALGRKNFLFAGSHEAASRAADLYSLTRTCALRDVPLLPYFADVLQKLADGWPDDRIDELTPDRWLELHGAEFHAQDDS
jgi:transposase